MADRAMPASVERVPTSEPLDGLSVVSGSKRLAPAQWLGGSRDILVVDGYTGYDDVTDL
jgi:hypothetical protein